MRVYGLLPYIVVLLVACQTPETNLKISPPTGQPPPTTDTTPKSAWSDPATWGGTLPSATSSVTIPAGKRVVLDSSVTVKNLTIMGTLEFADKDLELTSDYIMLHGALRIGTAIKPFERKATITLTGNTTENVMDMGSRGILVMGGKLELYGKSPVKAWTKLNDHAAAGATNLALLENTGWKAGDQIVVAPTDYQELGGTEAFEVTALNGNSLALRTGVQKARWGKLQYVSKTGMTLTPDTSVTPLVLDSRAEVGNLTRNIVIQGADDTLWNTQGFGAQVMVMVNSVVGIDGVELRRVGQQGKARRYPIHLHGMSYREDGTVLPDASDTFVRNSVIWNSKNRCVVIHGTNGVNIKNNICYDILGHAMFLEDGVELRNTFDGNLVLKVRSPVDGQELLRHESDGVAGSSGFWLTNPNNAVFNNAVADVSGHGIWYAFSKTPLGLFKNVKMFPPVHTAFGSFDNNVAHSNRQNGFHMDNASKDDAGNLEGSNYRPTATGQYIDFRYKDSLPYTISRLTMYKNDAGSLWHRQGGATFERNVIADSPAQIYAGSANCIIKDSISIGYSLNKTTASVNNGTSRPPVGMATYNGSCDVKNHLFVDLPFVPGKMSGALETGYYGHPVDKSLARATNLRFINAPIGFRLPAPVKDNFTYAGALWDPHGYAGPKGNYWTFDNPFLTDGANCQDVAPAGQTGKSCVGPYYGLKDFRLEKDDPAGGVLTAIEVTRNDNNTVWSVGDGRLAPMLGNMRHAALMKNGEYTLRFPGSPLPRTVSFKATNLISQDDWTMLSVQYSGEINDPWVYSTNDHNYYDPPRWDGDFLKGMIDGVRVRFMTPVGSVDEVRSSDGTKYYQDKANNLVYIKLRNGLTFPDEKNWEPDSEQALERRIHVVITPR